MKNYENANVCGKLRQALQTAAIIADREYSNEIRTAHLLAGILSVEDSALYITFECEGFNINVNGAIQLIEEDKEIFADIFGEENANVFFTYNSEDEDDDTAENEVNEENANGKELPDFIEANVEDGDIDALMYIGIPGMGTVGIPIVTKALPVISLPYSEDLESAFEKSYERCKKAGQEYIDIDNLTYALLEQENSSARRFLNYILYEIEKVPFDKLLDEFKGYRNIYTENNAVKVTVLPPTISSFCNVFNDNFNSDNTTDILCRDKEIEKVWNILSKKTKKNLVLVGDPGVGKTAIVEAITQSIVNGTCPKRFADYTVISLDVNSAIAGTMFRGQFEERVNELKNYLETADKVILFIDEIHHVMGAGSAEGSGVDLSGALKPILSRDQVRVIGATTTDEYNHIMARDGAFKRRFEIVTVKEPKIVDVKKMIAKKVENLCKYHNVTLEDGLIDKLVVASACFNNSVCNPDKTIDLCDRCMSLAECQDDTVVTERHIEKIFEENFEQFNKMSDELKKNLAYHEAGHYVVRKLTRVCKENKTILVSIIPGDDFQGVNLNEEIDEKVVEYDELFFKDYICVLLAGRVAERFSSKTLSSGASNDLSRANKIAKDMILKYGMAQGDYSNLSFGDYEEDSILRSDEMANKIMESALKLVHEQYNRAFKLLENNIGVLDRIANLLLDKKIVTSEELEKVFNS